MPQGRVHPNPGSVQVSKTLKDMTAIRKHGFQKPVVHRVFFAGLPRDRIMVVANTTAAHQNESFGGPRLGPSCWQPLALEMCMGKLHDRPMDKSTVLPWASLTSTAGDSMEMVQRPGGGTTRRQIRTNQRKAFNRRFLNVTQTTLSTLVSTTSMLGSPAGVWRTAHVVVNTTAAQ